MPHVPYWHLWTDADGVSHFSQAVLENFIFEGVGDADPQWNNKLFTGQSSIVFTEQPVGWIGEWHENPKPQWIVPISGRWWVEAMDGTRREFGPGDVQFGEDQNCRDWNNKRGHRSGTIGDVPCVLMCVQIDAKPQKQPGHFK